jgi:hypothetical protein
LASEIPVAAAISESSCSPLSFKCCKMSCIQAIPCWGLC